MWSLGRDVYARLLRVWCFGEQTNLDMSGVYKKGGFVDDLDGRVDTQWSDARFYKSMVALCLFMKNAITSYLLTIPHK